MITPFDLMFAGSMKQARRRREHVVVELKRPSVKVGRIADADHEIAVAVAAVARFTIKDWTGTPW